MDATEGRKRLLSAAIEVFAERGKYQARIEDIATKAGVSRSFLYRNYPTKNDLFRGMLRVVVEELFQELDSAVGPWKEDALSSPASRRLFDASLEILSRKPLLGKVAMHAMVSDSEEFVSAIRNAKGTPGKARAKAFATMVEESADEASKGSLQGSDADDLLAVVIGISLTYLLGKPMAESLLGSTIADEATFLSETKRNVIDLWTHGICVSAPPHSTSP